MKTKSSSAFAVIMGATMALFTPLALGQGKGNSGNNNSGNNNSGNNNNTPAAPKLPVIPVGWIDAYPTIVQTGTHPTIRWGVNLPGLVEDVIDISSGDTLVAKEEICIDCRVLGNGVTVHWSDGRWEFVPAEAFVSFNNGSFESVFEGTNHDVNPGEVVWQRSSVKKNETVRFGGKYKWNNITGTFYHSGSGTQNVRILTHGQMPPSYTPMNADIPSIEDFIKPYLNSSGRVNIGPMDVIVLMELTHEDSQHGHPGYDLQDMVMLCTMSKITKKNNNRSGLADGTNPGKGNQMGNNDGTNNPNNAPHSGGSN